jgi:lipoprotein-anchoring transpeptidase ErfK/SrfK
VIFARPSPNRYLTATFAGLALLAAGCGAASHARHSAVASVRKKAVPRCAPGTRRRLDTGAVAWAAVVVRPTQAYRFPAGSRLARFGLRNVNGAPTVFSVLGAQLDARCRATWLHVELPMRPNGATGWVRAADVETAGVRTRIVVDLSTRRVRLYRNGRLVLESPAAVGAPATPTPTGRFYVNQRLVPLDPTGPFGPGAVGVSAFSNVQTGWAQGGPIGIHGTNEPWSIGHAVSNGCIRLPNAVIRRLFAAALPGTPVVIIR